MKKYIILLLLQVFVYNSHAQIILQALEGSGPIATLDCAGAIHTGTLIQASAASGVNSVISYTGGDGSAHTGQIVASTGVTGLTATLVAGSFAVGAGTLTYTITGTPINSGTASFAINIGGITCTLTRVVLSNIAICSSAGLNTTLAGYGTTAFGNGTITTTAINGAATFPGGYTQCNLSPIHSGDFYSGSSGLGDVRLSFSNPFTGKIKITVTAFGGEQLIVKNETSGANISPIIVNNCNTMTWNGTGVTCPVLGPDANSSQVGYSGGTLTYNFTGTYSVLLDFSGGQNGTIFTIQVLCN